MPRLTILSLILLAVFTLFIVACDDDDGVSPSTPAFSFNVTPDTLHFDGDDVYGIDTLYISVEGEGGDTWSLYTDADWIVLDPDEGITWDGETDTVVVCVIRLGVPIGDYEDVILFGQSGESTDSVVVQMEVVPPDPYTLVNDSDLELYEGETTLYGPYTLTYDTVPTVTLELLQWPGDYEFEVLLFSEDEYTRYTQGESFETFYNLAVTNTGTYEETATDPIPAETTLYVVLDNSDLGYYATDGDNSDLARFNFKLEMTPQE